METRWPKKHYLRMCQNHQPKEAEPLGTYCQNSRPRAAGRRSRPKREPMGTGRLNLFFNFRSKIIFLKNAAYEAGTSAEVKKNVKEWGAVETWIKNLWSVAEPLAKRNKTKFPTAPRRLNRQKLSDRFQYFRQIAFIGG